jgi:HlyD family secretion protein
MIYLLLKLLFKKEKFFLKEGFVYTLFCMSFLFKINKRIFSLFALFLVLFFISFFIFRSDEDTLYETEILKKENLEKRISVIGVLERENKIDLAFPFGGTLLDIPFTEGSFVKEGDIIAVLDMPELNAEKEEREAQVARQKALLEEVETPLRTEKKDVLYAQKKEAMNVYENAQKSVIQQMQTLFIHAHTAVRKTADQLFTDGDTLSPSFGTRLSVKGKIYDIKGTPQESISLTTLRREIVDLLEDMEKNAYTSLEKHISLVENSNKFIASVEKIEKLLTEISEVLSTYRKEEKEDQAIYEEFSLSISHARTSLVNAKNVFIDTQKALILAENSLEKVEKDILLAEAGATDEQIKSATESLRASEASLRTIEERIKQGTLKSPYDGVVSRLSFSAGSVVRAFDSVGEIIPQDVPHIEMYIPEADIRDVAVFDSAEIRFDSFERDEVFEGSVTFVSESAVVREGVPTYKTILTLTVFPETERPFILRSGMTADVDIIVEELKDVLSVPRRAIFYDENNTPYVRIKKEKNSIEKRNVILGLRGTAGRTEIKEGVFEGEEVVISETIKEK